MTLSFQTHIDGKPTNFVPKIYNGLFAQNNPEQHDHLSSYITNDLNVEHSERVSTALNATSTTEKIHTIREDKTKRWRPGMDIHFSIYNRQKDRTQFAPVIPCVSIQRIEIMTDNIEIMVFVDGHLLSRSEMSWLAANDGFDTFGDFANYFKDGFTGRIIHWTDFKY